MSFFSLYREQTAEHEVRKLHGAYTIQQLLFSDQGRRHRHNPNMNWHISLAWNQKVLTRLLV